VRSRARRRRLLFLFFFAALSIIAYLSYDPPTGWAAPPDRGPRGDLIRSANQAVDDGRYADARDAWLRIWELDRSRVAACNIGELSVRIGDMPIAAEFLAICVRRAQEDPEPERQREEGHVLSLARARQAVGTLTFRVRDGADITVDGRPLGRAPLDHEVFVAPGSHRVRAVQGGELGEVAVEVPAGAERRVDVPLAAPPTPAPQPRRAPPRQAPQPRQAPPPRQAPDRPQGWLVVAGFAISSALLVTGTGLLITSIVHESRGDDLIPKVNGCYFSLPQCQGARAAYESVEPYRSAGAGALIASAALAAGTLTYTLFPRGHGKVGVRGGVVGSGIGMEGVW
jgi:hypothetical protein